MKIPAETKILSYAAPLRRLRTSWLPSEGVKLLVLSFIVGIATSIGVWMFREGIDFFQRTFRDPLLVSLSSVSAPLAVVAIVPVLALAGLIVGFLKHRFVGEERLHGVAGIMESIGYSGGRLRYRLMPIKTALASFSLGAGASVGPEDPSVQIGTSIGSALGQWLHLSEQRVKLLVGAGAAGGIAAVFGAPIAGVFFALEVILGDFSTSAFGVVVLTAVIASAVTQAIDLGGITFTRAATPELGISAYALGGLQEIPLYVLLGIIVAPISAVFIRTLYWQHDLWHHMKLPQPLKTALAGVVVGGIAIFLPHIMGTGRETLNNLLNGNTAEFSLVLLIALVAGKIIGTTVSLGGGFVGGMFAPSLFVGAAAGRAFGQILVAIAPGALGANPAAFAIAGMAAAMAGIIRAPITAMILLFELTGDYRLILPIMLTTAVSLIVVEKLAPQGLYHFGLARKGIRLVQGRDIDLMQAITVHEVMTKKPQTVPASLLVSELPGEFDKHNSHGLVVVDDQGLLYGVVTLQDFARASSNTDGRTVGEICTRDVFTVTPRTSVADALRLLSARNLGRLPVVESDNSRKVVGLLRRHDVVRAYDLAMRRKQEAARVAEQIRLEALSSAHILELHVQPNTRADGNVIRELPWPAGCVVAAVRRQGKVIIPRGDTMLRAGDRLTIVTMAEDLPELAKLVSEPNSTPTPAASRAQPNQPAAMIEEKGQVG